MIQTERRLTTADLAELPTLLPSGSVRYELWEGALCIMSPTGGVHGKVEARITGLLLNQGEARGHGQVCSGEVGIVLSRQPDTVLGADVAFLTNDQLPERYSPEGYLETVPALIVEVISKNDRRREIDERVKAYLAAGARMVWLADPQQRTFTIHQPDTPPRILRQADTLTAEELIPGLSFHIGHLFEGLL
jgi:Uma2 family endonuclease